MKVGVLGAGAIGGYLGVRLAAAGADVVLVGRERLTTAAQDGLTAVDLGGASTSARPRVATDPAALSDVDVCLVGVKSAALEAAAESLQAHLPSSALVVPMQNGIFARDRLLAAGVTHRVVSGLVVFNVVWSDSTFRQTTSGPVAFGDAPQTRALSDLLRTAGDEAVVSADIEAHQAGKLLLNLNNGLCAICGLPLRAFLEARPARRALAAVIREGLQVFSAGGRAVKGFGLIDPRIAHRVLPLPDWAFTRVASKMLTVDPQAKTSTLQDLERGRPTEIDDLTGAVVKVAETAGVRAPKNAWVVDTVKQLERGEGRSLSPAELWAAIERA